MFRAQYKKVHVRTPHLRGDSGRLVKALERGWRVYETFSNENEKVFFLKLPWWRAWKQSEPVKAFAVKLS